MGIQILHRHLVVPDSTVLFGFVCESQQIQAFSVADLLLDLREAPADRNNPKKDYSDRNRVRDENMPVGATKTLGRKLCTRKP